MDSVLIAKQILENYDARVPRDNDRVHKDECLYSFDSPVSIIIHCRLFFSQYSNSEYWIGILIIAM